MFCRSVLDQAFEPAPSHSVRDKSVSCMLEMQIPKIESESVLSLCTGSASFIHSSNVLVQLDFYHSPSVWDFLLLWSGQLKAGRVWGLKEEEDSGNETNDGHGWRRGGEVHAPRKENWFGGKGRKCNMLQKNTLPGMEFSFTAAPVLAAIQLRFYPHAFLSISFF